SQPDRRPHVIGEYEKRRAERDESTVICQAIHGGPHRMLAHAEVDIAPCITPAAAGGALRALARTRRRFEVAVLLEPREGRWIEISRAADELGNGARERLQHALRCLARRHPLGVGGKCWKARVPARRQLAAKASFDLGRELWELFAVRGEAPVPAVL